MKRQFANELAKRDDELANQKVLYQKLWEKSTAENSSSPTPNSPASSSSPNTSNTSKEVQQAIDGISEKQRQWRIAAADLLMSLSRRVGSTEAYSRLNSLLWHHLPNIPEKAEGENAGLYTYRFCEWIVDQLNELFEGKLGSFKLTIGDIDTAHVLKTKSGKSNVVIVKFVRRTVRNLFWFNKRELGSGDSGVSVTEHLTEYNLNLLKAAKNVLDKKFVWTNQCQVFVKIGDRKHAISTKVELSDLTGETIHMQDTFLDHYNNAVSTVATLPDNSTASFHPVNGTYSQATQYPPNNMHPPYYNDNSYYDNRQRNDYYNHRGYQRGRPYNVRDRRGNSNGRNRR